MNSDLANANVVKSFYRAIGPQSRLYNGKRYEFYDPAIQSNAYYMDKANWSKGSVYYDGYLYQDVDLLYDLFSDQLITQLYHSFLKISLIKEKVKGFDMFGHHFIYVRSDTSKNVTIKTGFYDQLYAGRSEILVRREKSIQTSKGFNGSIDSYFTPATADYYLYKNGAYRAVNSKKAFFNAFRDKKEDIKQFVKANKINYRKAKEQAMVKIAEYYDHLSN